MNKGNILEFILFQNRDFQMTLIFRDLEVPRELFAIVRQFFCSSLMSLAFFLVVLLFLEVLQVSSSWLHVLHRVENGLQKLWQLWFENNQIAIVKKIHNSHNLIFRYETWCEFWDCFQVKIRISKSIWMFPSSLWCFHVYNRATKWLMFPSYISQL